MIEATIQLVCLAILALYKIFQEVRHWKNHGTILPNKEGK